MNCLPIAYHPLLVTLSPSPSPSPPSISCLSLLSSLTHSTLRSTAERHRLTFNTIISVCLKTYLSVCLPPQSADCRLIIYPHLFFVAITWPNDFWSFLCIVNHFRVCADFYFEDLSLQVLHHICFQMTLHLLNAFLKIYKCAIKTGCKCKLACSLLNLAWHKVDQPLTPFWK